MITRLAVFDIDGTLANDAARGTMPSDQYYSPHVIAHLPSNGNVVRYYHSLAKKSDTYTCVLTGRPEDVRHETTAWLDNIDIKDIVYMRPATISLEFVSVFKLKKVLELLRELPDVTEVIVLDDLLETLTLIKENFPASICLRLYMVQEGVVCQYWDSSTN